MSESRQSVAVFASNAIGLVTEKMYGMDEVIKLCLVALYTGGHILLEGNPGLGKTALVKRLGEVLALEFGRIQFTPDLMPADITGSPYPGSLNIGIQIPGNSWRFQPGPIFTSLLLADEINRATPKTQAALLEAMAERHVTSISGDRYPAVPKEVLRELLASGAVPKERLCELWQSGNIPEEKLRGLLESVAAPKKLLRELLESLTLSKERSDELLESVIRLINTLPFMVLATQNPIDREGTYDLPEAQSDRFMFKVLMPLPAADKLQRVLFKEAGVLADIPEAHGRRRRIGDDTPEQQYTLGEDWNNQQSIDWYRQIVRQVEQVKPSAGMQMHIMNLILATNGRHDPATMECGADTINEWAGKRLWYGLGPRAIKTMMLGAKAWTLLFEPGHDKADGASLARIAIPVLRHRLKAKPETERFYHREHDMVSKNRRLDYMIKDLCHDCAPSRKVVGSGYMDQFESELDMVLREQAF